MKSEIEKANVGEVREDFRVIREIHVDDLYQSATNPRKEFDEEKLVELKDSIEEMGVRQCLIVRELEENPGKFEIVAGERRWRAGRRAGLVKLPCEVWIMTDREVVTFQLVENIQRADLSLIEELEGCEELIAMGVPSGDLARSLGKSLNWVQDRLSLGDLPTPARIAVGEGLVDLRGAREILKVEEEEREKFSQEILELGEVPSAEQLARVVEERYLVPAANRQRWADWCDERCMEEGVRPIEDCEKWAEYVRPYGEGVGSWKPEGEAIGGLAARADESGVTWGVLARVHGVEMVLVPIGGVRSGEIRPIVLVDRGKVEAAERGQRQNGLEFTMGPRKMKVAEDPQMGADSGEVGGDDGGKVEGKARAAGIVDFEEVSDSYVKVPVVKVGRASVWNPWLVDQVPVEAEHLLRGVLVRDVLGQECPGWEGEFLDVVGEPVTNFDRPETFWVLRKARKEEVIYKKIAGLLGVLECLGERMGWID